MSKREAPEPQHPGYGGFGSPLWPVPSESDDKEPEKAPDDKKETDD